MLPTTRHLTAEARFVELVEDADLPRPDRVEYWPDELVLFWDGPKTAVVVELHDRVAEPHA
jgi:hypothetical protein